MSLQSKIREDMVNAMKNKDRNTVDFLRVVAGEFGREMNNGIELQDDQVITILKRMKKDAITMGNDSEVVILDKYLPQMLGELQIKTIVGGIIQKNGLTGMESIGRVMGTLKTHPMAAQIDNKIASQVARELLSQ